MLKQCCVTQLQKDFDDFSSVSEELPPAKSEEIRLLQEKLRSMFPFLSYAVENILYHADASQAGAIDQRAFLANFPWTLWISIDNVFQRHQSRRHADDAQSLYILLEYGAANLVETHSDGVKLLQLSRERYRYSFVAAYARGHYKTLRALLLQAVKAIQPGDLDVLSCISHELEHLAGLRANRDLNGIRLMGLVQRSKLSYILQVWLKFGTKFVLASYRDCQVCIVSRLISGCLMGMRPSGNSP